MHGEIHLLFHGRRVQLIKHTDRPSASMYCNDAYLNVCLTNIVVLPLLFTRYLCMQETTYIFVNIDNTQICFKSGDI